MSLSLCKQNHNIQHVTSRESAYWKNIDSRSRLAFFLFWHQSGSIHNGQKEILQNGFQQSDVKEMTRIQTESSAAPGKSAVQQWFPHFGFNNPDSHYISKTIIHDFWLKIFNDIICLPIISKELPYILYPCPTNGGTTIDPMVESSWVQGPFFLQYCPKENKNGSTATVCETYQPKLTM